MAKPKLKTPEWEESEYLLFAGASAPFPTFAKEELNAGFEGKGFALFETIKLRSATELLKLSKTFDSAAVSELKIAFLEYKKMVSSLPSRDNFEIRFRDWALDICALIERSIDFRYNDFHRMEVFVSEIVEKFKSFADDPQTLERAVRKVVSALGCAHLLASAAKSLPSSTAALKPASPPEIFRHRADKQENAPSFISRVYGQWLTGEFTRADLRRLDPTATEGLKNWERAHGKADLDLPTIAEANDRKLVSLGELSEDAAVELRRLSSAAVRRGKKPKSHDLG